MARILRGALRRASRYATLAAYAGRGRFCPVCEGWSRKFLSHGHVPRLDARCVRCGAIERHRLVWLFFQRRTDLFDGRPKSMLHFAPEPWFEKRLRARLGPAYRTADLNNPRVDVRMDICDIQYPDQTFDVVYCSHVLEHVQDDAKAMAEMRRVVKRSGWVVLMVPIIAPATHEDPRVTDPQERLRLYGQNDHVRAYGPDFVDRVRAAGFEVGVFRRQDLAAPDEIARMGLSRSGEVFYCRPSGDPPLRQPSSPEPRPKG